MRQILSFLTLALLLASPPSAPAAAPKPAREILSAAQRQAGLSHRSVLVLFHASWCSWCGKLETALSRPDVRKIIDRHFVVTGLDVMERGEKKDSLENPGGTEIMKGLGGEKSGLPFYAVLSARGKKLGDSNRMPGSTNIGYPGTREELAAFESMLRDTAPRMSADQRAVIMKAFAPTPAP